MNVSKFWSSAVWRTEPYIPGEQPVEKNIIKLNTNENPYPPSPKVIEAIMDEAGNSLRLYPSPSADELRKTAARVYGINENQVFIGNGSDEVLAFSFLAFFNTHEKLLFPDITYSFYPVYAKLYDLSYEEVPLNHDFTISIDEYFDSEGGVILPNPNAPTGVYLELTNIEEILRNNPFRVVIIDEAYIDFGGNSAVSLIDRYDNLLVVQTLSKSRSLAGLRVGFAFGSRELIDGLERIKNSFNSYTLDRLALVGAKAALEDTRYFEETRSKIMTTREKVSLELEKLGFIQTSSKANFLFVRHKSVPAKLIFKKLKDRGIFVRYFNKPQIDQYIRVTIGSDEEMEFFIKAVEQIIRTNDSSIW